MRTFLFILFFSLLFSCKKGIEIVNVPDEPPINDSTLRNAVIVCDGNSITLGQPFGISYPEQLQQTTPFSEYGVRIYNKGVGGQETNAMRADASTDIDPLYDSLSSTVGSEAWNSRDLKSRPH